MKMVFAGVKGMPAPGLSAFALMTRAGQERNNVDLSCGLEAGQKMCYHTATSNQVHYGNTA